MAGQKVELNPPPESFTSRPLKTGKSFTLVLPRHRFVYRHWDKEKYLPEEEAELIMEGENLGKGPFEFVVEAADGEDGPWHPVTTLKATVDGDKATAKFKFPKNLAHGHLTKAEWKRTKARLGDRIGLHVEAEGYEGGWIGIHVERKDPETGEWKGYTRWQGHIENGKLDDVFQCPPPKTKYPQHPGAEVSELKWVEKPRENAIAWLEALTKNLDGTKLQFVLERADEKGNWHEIGNAVSTVKDNEAKNSVQVRPVVRVGPAGGAPGSGGGMLPIRFQKAVFHKGEELALWVDPQWLKGQGFEVKMERRLVKDGAGWEEVAVVEAKAEAKGPGDDRRDLPPPDPKGDGRSDGRDAPPIDKGGTGGPPSGAPPAGPGGSSSGPTDTTGPKGAGGNDAGGSSAGGQTSSGGTGATGSGTGGSGGGSGSGATGGQGGQTGTGGSGGGSGTGGSGGSGGGSGSGGSGSGASGSGGSGASGTGGSGASGGSGSGGSGASGTGGSGAGGSGGSGSGSGSGSGASGGSGGSGGSGSGSGGGGAGGSGGSGGSGSGGSGSGGGGGAGGGAGGASGASGSQASAGGGNIAGAGSSGAAGAIADQQGGGVSGLEVGGIAAGVGGVGSAVAAGVATAEDTKAQADELGGKAGTQDSDKVEE